MERAELSQSTFAAIWKFALHEKHEMGCRLVVVTRLWDYFPSDGNETSSAIAARPTGVFTRHNPETKYLRNAQDRKPT
jgi:hypothetical protein